MNSDKDNVLKQIADAEQLRMMVTAVNDYAIYMLNPDGYIVSWNAGAQRFKGYTQHEIIGNHFSVFYTEEDRQAQIPVIALKTAMEKGKFEAEGWRVRKDGTRFWAHVVIDPIRDEQDRLVGFAKVTRDISDRKAAQDALKASEERFRLLVQGVTDYAIYMLSPAGLITNWNSGAQRIKGYSEEEVIGTHFSRFFTEEDRADKFPERALATAAEKGRFESEGWRVRKDGTKFWAHAVLDAIYDDSGEFIGFAKITRDITEKKKAAEALEQANAALFQSQKMEAIGQLTGGIAHDFNNLLSVMSTGLDILASRLNSHGDIKLMESMQRSVQRAALLTQQLLSFARKQPLQVDRHNLNTLIADFESVLRRAGNPSISFEIKREANLRMASIDATRFESALLNLAVNARDAMPSGGQLTITTENADLTEREIGSLPAGRYVKVSVSDTGIGMPPEVATRVFEPFFTTKSLGEGTGLGLSQLYGFVLQSGGEVTVQTQVGKGTTFSMYFPALADEADTAGQESPTEKAADTVLIVEDEQDLLGIAAELFRVIGYEVITASNGKEAADILARRSDIQVLFTDIMMPNGPNGVELARQARQKYPGIRTILTSGYALPVIESSLGSIREFPLVQKPYRLSEVVNVLRSANHPSGVSESPLAS